MAEKSGIDKVCTSENFVRGNYFSNTYRADLKVGEELGSWDVVHISLPFSPLKEKELQVRFNLDDDALQDFYKTFGRSVKNCILVSTLLADANVKSVVQIVSYIIEMKEPGPGSDIYLICRPMELFVDVMQWHQGNFINLSDVISLAIRLLQINKGLNDNQAHLGIIDMDCLYMMPENDKKLVTLGGLMYAGHEKYDYVSPPGIDLPHCHPSLKNGGSATTETDLYSIASLIWALLDGRHYTEAPDFSKPPQYAPPGIIPSLQAAIRGLNGSDNPDVQSDIIKNFAKSLRAAMKMISSGVLPNEKIIMGQPKYDLSEAYTLLRESKKNRKQEEQEAQSEHEPEPTPSSDTFIHQTENDNSNISDSATDSTADGPTGEPSPQPEPDSGGSSMEETASNDKEGAHGEDSPSSEEELAEEAEIVEEAVIVEEEQDIPDQPEDDSHKQPDDDSSNAKGSEPVTEEIQKTANEPETSSQTEALEDDKPQKQKEPHEEGSPSQEPENKGASSPSNDKEEDMRGKQQTPPQDRPEDKAPVKEEKPSQKESSDTKPESTAQQPNNEQAQAQGGIPTPYIPYIFPQNQDANQQQFGGQPLFMPQPIYILQQPIQPQQTQQNQHQAPTQPKEEPASPSKKEQSKKSPAEKNTPPKKAITDVKPPINTEKAKETAKKTLKIAKKGTTDFLGIFFFTIKKILITMAILAIIAIVVYVYIYPELIKPVMTQFFVDEYMKALAKALETSTILHTAV